MSTRNIVCRNVTILPSHEVTQKAIELSRKVFEQFDSQIVLNAHNYLPHLTLHQFALPEDQLDSLAQRVIAAIRSFHNHSIHIHLTGANKFGDGGIWWDATITELLWDLHRQLVNFILPIQEHYLMPHLVGISTGKIDVSSSERAACLKYGNPWANSEKPAFPFRPHVTLSKVMISNDMLEALLLLKNEQIGFEAFSVHITEIGPHGTCPGSLQCFDLGQ